MARGESDQVGTAPREPHPERQMPRWTVLAKQGNDSVIGFTDASTDKLPGRNAARPYRGSNRSAAQVLRHGAER